MKDFYESPIYDGTDAEDLSLPCNCDDPFCPVCKEQNRREAMLHVGDGDSVVRCHKLSAERPLPGAFIIRCDSCNEQIIAGPQTKNKQGKKGWHIVCTECFADVLAQADAAQRPAVFAGAYRVGQQAPWERNRYRRLSIAFVIFTIGAISFALAWLVVNGH